MIRRDDTAAEKKVLALLKKTRRVLVTMHVHPDPDAMGAALAMTLYLRSLGKDARLFNEDACPFWLRFMPKAAALCRQVTGRERFRPDVVVVLDCGDLERTGKAAALIGKAPVINIDHHVTNTMFGAFNIVHQEASSTSEILYGFLRAAKAVLTRDMAIQLYLGIMTDTGSFGFDSTTPATHRVVADLLEFNIPVGELYRKVHETLPKEDLEAFLAIMSRLELGCGGRVALLGMTKEQQKVFSPDFDFKDKVFGLMRSVSGVEVIVILTESDGDTVRVNLRSRGPVDVAAFAGKFGGGGHKKASGCKVLGTIAHARQVILAALTKEF